MLSKMRYRQEYGTRLAKFRAERGLSLAAIAAHCGVTIAAVQQWENGSTTPERERRQKLEALLSASFEDSVVMADRALASTPYAARAARLRQARQAAGFKTVGQAAQSMGVAYSSYAAHECGLRPFRKTALEAYARAFGVDPIWLETGETAAGESGGGLAARLKRERQDLLRRAENFRDQLAIAEKEIAAIDEALKKLGA